MRFLTVLTGAAACFSAIAGAFPASSGTVSTHANDFDVASFNFTTIDPASFPDHLEKRRMPARWARGAISCPGPFWGAKTEGFKKVVKYLRSLKGRPSLAAETGWGICWDVCMKDGTQVSWCNQDKKHRKTLESWNSVAEAIEVLLGQKKCTRKEGGHMITGGGIYHPTQWYVVATRCVP